MLRAQVSLQFGYESADLYHNYVVPLKEDRSLAPLLVRLLTSYYTSQSVRELIDGLDESEFREQTTELEDTSFLEARKLLSIMNGITAEMGVSLENGIYDVNSIVDAMVTATKGKASEDTTYGTTAPSFNLGLPLHQNNEEVSTNPIQGTDIADRVSTIEVKLDKLIELMTNNKDSIQTNKDKGISPIIQTNPVEISKVNIDDSSVITPEYFNSNKNYSVPVYIPDENFSTGVLPFSDEITINKEDTILSDSSDEVKRVDATKSLKALSSSKNVVMEF